MVKGLLSVRRYHAGVSSLVWAAGAGSRRGRVVPRGDESHAAWLGAREASAPEWRGGCDIGVEETGDRVRSRWPGQHSQGLAWRHIGDVNRAQHVDLLPGGRGPLFHALS